MTTPTLSATIAGYPRIGANRELKKTLEAYWAKRITRPEFEEATAQIRRARLERLIELGLGAPGALPGDFVLYDQVLTTTCALGAVPQRFGDLAGEGGALDVDGEFTMARGVDDKAALEMTKWFDSNYHYMVPEIGPLTPIRAVANPWVDQVEELVAWRGEEARSWLRPVLVGPLTWLLLSKPAIDAPGYDVFARLDDVAASYETLLGQLAGAGVSWVQFDEPALVSDTWSVPVEKIRQALKTVYTRLGNLGAQQRPALVVNGSYGDLGVEIRQILADTKVEALGLDLVAGTLPQAEELSAWQGRTLVAGIVSGRNIWRTNLDSALTILEELRDRASGVNIAVSSSTSLQHVPHDSALETGIDPQVRSWLAFADQKIAEVKILAHGLSAGRAAIDAEINEDTRLRFERASHPGVNNPAIRRATAEVSEADRSRAPYEQRLAAQDKKLGLPLLPTTTIGSFPQTTEIRKARAAFTKGELSAADYEEAMRKEIRQVVKLQEDLGLDVLVHGEAERNDMVQYFAEQLEGFEATTHGWVQSYGSRCTRPSILWGDVSRPQAMTVKWSTFAQSCTSKPMKGMLTGPVTIMAWSFVRDDVDKKEVADQIGLALRAEVADLEAAGIGIIQVDEPAIRELLPLRSGARKDYLDWSVGSFRLATAGAGLETQIHTHLCYSEFNVVVDAIDHLDADVTSIEASRSKMDILPAVSTHGFERQLGPGIWDIHSPRVPSTGEMANLLRKAVAALGARKLWANPDCGLKTRAYPETEATLKNLVEATRTVRAEL